MQTLDYWQFEDEMDEAGIFVSGIDGRTTSRESYNTVMDYEKMEAFLKNKKGFSVNEWKLLVEHFQSIAYLSPMNYLVAKEIMRFMS
jgi:hypothetical protein